MSEYFFGLGKNWLSKKANKIAEKHGAYLVNYIDPQCNCGYGCKPHTCNKSKRHWFACKNLGHPFDTQTASEVLKDLRNNNLIN
ncbi:MAG: hypothetical protein AABY22_07035 [Nanoarchaeota archaeon]